MYHHPLWGPTMTVHRVGFLHPGEMGTALASLVRNNGCDVCWVPAGRSPASAARAARAGLVAVGSLAELCASCDLIVSVCPPHAALDVAHQVAALSFSGLYLDANAIAPERAREISTLVTAGGATFIDGAVIGPPPLDGTNTYLYLCGPGAAAAACYFAGGPIAIEQLGLEIGRASALKICHSSMHKGALALLFSTLAASERLGVRRELEESWATRAITAGYVTGIDSNLRRAAKAWRFTGEMDEVACTLEAAGLPAGFHQAASVTYRRLAGLGDGGPGVSLEQILAALLAGPEAPRGQ